MSPGFLMVYSLRALGSGPHFNELAAYFSFEQIIHYAFDGFYSIKYEEMRDQWLEMIEANIIEYVDADYNKPCEVNSAVVSRHVQNLFIFYVDWLSSRVAFPDESAFACVEDVWFEGDTVYVRGYDYDKEPCGGRQYVS